MALPINVAYIFSTATTTIPLSQLDTNFSTVYTAVNQLGNGVLSFSNISVTGGNVTLSAALPVNSGGTNLTSITANSIMIGNNANTIQLLSPGASGNVIVSNGTNWIAATQLTVNSGGTNLTSITANSVMIGNAANTIQLLSPGANGNVMASNGTNWISTALVNNAILTTKGDLLTFSTTQVRMGVGLNGQALVADSTQTNGIKWASVAGAVNNVTTYNANTTISWTTDLWAVLQLTSGSAVYTLPTAVGNAGKGFLLSNTTTSDTALRLVPNGAEAVGFATGATIYVPGGTTIGFVSDGANLIVFFYSGKRTWVWTAGGTFYTPPWFTSAIAALGTLVGGGGGGYGPGVGAGGTTSIGALLSATGGSGNAGTDVPTPGGSPNGNAGSCSAAGGTGFLSRGGDSPFGSGGVTQSTGGVTAASGYGGGGSSATASTFAGGGGGGYRVRESCSPVPGTPYTVTIGAAGAAGTGAGAGTAGIAIMEI